MCQLPLLFFFEFSVNSGCRYWLFQLKAIGLSLCFLYLLPPIPDFPLHAPQCTWPPKLCGHKALMFWLQVSDFREQLLACSGVEADRVVEFSCGKEPWGG